MHVHESHEGITLNTCGVVLTVGACAPYRCRQPDDSQHGRGAPTAVSRCAQPTTARRGGVAVCAYRRQQRPRTADVVSPRAPTTRDQTHLHARIYVHAVTMKYKISWYLCQQAHVRMLVRGGVRRRRDVLLSSRVHA